MQIGLIKCSPRENGITSQVINLIADLIELNFANLGVTCKVFNFELLSEKNNNCYYVDELTKCTLYIWGSPIYCASLSHHSRLILENYSKCMLNKMHLLVISGGSNNFFLAYKDFAFQLMIETNSIVFPKPIFILSDGGNISSILDEQFRHRILNAVNESIKIAFLLNKL